jgi:vanillate/4-hydroxybenzoate decarboxylase subunit D
VATSKLVCPRCGAGKISVLSESPVAGVWTIHRCETCLYAWRDTEPLENRDPDHYPEAFRIRQEEIGHFPIMPTVPPLLKK